MDERLDWMISVDDHVIEPGHLWVDRMPARYKESCPRLVREGDDETWVYDGKRIPTFGLAAVAGKPRDEWTPTAVTYDEMRPGCYDPKARIADMNTDGVLASLCFPSFPRFCGQQFYEAEDRALALLCVKAWNDFMIDEWAGSAPGRLIPMMILPLWDPVEAAAEVHRCAALGTKAVAFSENPVPLGLPSIHSKDRYWDPVFAAVEETGMPLTIHVGSSSQLRETSPDAPAIIKIALGPMNACEALADWVFSSVPQRFPDLKVCLSEGGIGWIPYVLERCEWTLDRQGAWAAKGDVDFDINTGKMQLRGDGTGSTYDRTPNQVFQDQIFGCFIDDVHGVQSLDTIGVDKVMIETDYPHSDTTWPDSMATARQHLAGRSDEDVLKIFRTNAMRVFDFEPAAFPDHHG